MEGEREDIDIIEGREVEVQRVGHVDRGEIQANIHSGVGRQACTQTN